MVQLTRPLQALLWDMDGVLAEVSLSYRSAIVETAKHFGAIVTLEDIERAKLAGNANNDWQLTQRLIAAAAIDGAAVPTLEQVTQVFEDLYQGVEGKPGLCLLETLLTPKGLLEELNRRVPKGMAIVTGRPRKDCIKFLEAHGCVTGVAPMNAKVLTLCVAKSLALVPRADLYGGLPAQAVPRARAARAQGSQRRGQ
jgi:HAD superfamily hydrolase (TIGR01548 family)